MVDTLRGIILQRMAESQAFYEKEIIQIIINIAQGIKMLHYNACPIMHRNICVIYIININPLNIG